MKLRCCRTVVCRSSIPSLKQLAPSNCAPSKGGRVVKWLLIPRNFTRFALRKSLLSAMWKSAQTLIVAVPALKNASLLCWRKGSLLLPTGSDQCTGHSALGGCVIPTSTVVIRH